MAGGGDAGLFEQAGLGAAHAVDGAAEHGLDGRVWREPRVERALDGVDVGDVGFVGRHPSADGGVEFVKVLDDEGAASVVAVGADAVEGEDEGVAEFVDVAAEPERGGVGEMRAGDELGGDGLGAEGAEGAGDGAVGADQDAGVVEAERAQDAHGEGVAAAGGDDDLDAGGLRRRKRAARLRGLTWPLSPRRVPSMSMAIMRRRAETRRDAVGSSAVCAHATPLPYKKSCLIENKRLVVRNRKQTA